MFRVAPMNGACAQTNGDRNPGGYVTAVNVNAFGKRSARQDYSVDSNKVAKGMPGTPISSFKVARDVRESSL